MIATKEQERAAIAKIRKIVDSLGENSYVGTALEGCLEIADQNIEYDAADSLRGRLEIAEAELKEAQGKVKTLELDNRDLRAAVARAKGEASKTITVLRERVLPEADVDCLLALATERLTALEAEAKAAAEKIVELATEPTGAAFQQAVSDHRSATRAAEKYAAIIERISKAQPR